jgi:hypothetical protein
MNMPQLPSGLSVGLSIDPALEKAKEGHFFFRIFFKVQVRSFEDVGDAVSITYYRPKQGVPDPGEAYPSGMTLSALGTDRCDWQEGDVEYLKQWLTGAEQQQWLRTAYKTLVEALSKSKPAMPENLVGIMDDDDDHRPSFNVGRPEEYLPNPVVNVIGELIKRDNVQSVSFPFNNTKVWRMLVDEQLCRAKNTDLPNQQAFALSGPDSGLSCDPTEWGGVVHIPYEGCCMGDLFIVPEWRNLFRETNSATLSTSYHYLLAQRDLGELNCAIRRDIGDGWFLYESTRPYERADMLGDRLIAELSKRND